MAAPAGLIFQVQRWSIHDGAGIRSTVFLKGCPLRCAWCANPESWSAEVGAGFGERVTVGELMARLRRDEVFYRESGGGVTFSGGEPLAQPRFLLAALEACGESGYRCAAETSLAAPWEEAWPALRLLDEVFCDIKVVDGARHRELTGAGNGLILANARRLLEARGRVTVRVPLVAGVNDGEGDLEALGDFLRGAPGLAGVEFMPYHDLGVGKYPKLGLPKPPSSFAPPAKSHLRRLAGILQGRGLAVACAAF